MSAQAVSKVNLLPTDRFEYSKLGRFLGWALTAGRIAVVLTELVVIIAFLSRFWFDRKLNDLRERRVQKEAVVDSYADIQTRFTKVQAQLSAIRNILNQQANMADRLTEIQSLTPQGVSYSKMVVSSQSARLTGYTQTPSLFSVLLTNLQNKAGEENVTVKNLVLSKDHVPGFDFEVDMKQPKKEAGK